MKRNKMGQFISEELRGNQFAKGNLPNKTSFISRCIIVLNYEIYLINQIINRNDTLSMFFVAPKQQGHTIY